MALAKIGPDALNDGVADLVERVHLGNRLFVALGDLETSFVEGVPRAVTARQRQRGGLADMTHAESIDKTLERDAATILDRCKEIANRGRAIALDLFQLQLVVAFLEGKNVGRLLHPFLVEEILQLFFTETIDVERPPRHEQFQVLDLLER